MGVCFEERTNTLFISDYKVSDLSCARAGAHEHAYTHTQHHKKHGFDIHYTKANKVRSLFLVRPEFDLSDESSVATTVTGATGAAAAV